MYAIFLADAHLDQPDDVNYRTMLRFLADLPNEVDTLFILGDFFEFWIGYPTVPFPKYTPIIEALQRLTERGIRLVFSEGNHDFHMGPVFRERLRAQVHPGPATITLDGRTVHLCHGDQIKDDRRYRLLRGCLHGPLPRWLIHVVPPPVTAAIGDWMGHRSKAAQRRQKCHWDPTGLIQNFARQQFAQGCDVVITGHFHTPLLETVAGKTILALGDWITQYSYAEWRDGSLSLKNYR
jgi:UDP-2,3-diacylglucosamine hydrolase